MRILFAVDEHSYSASAIFQVARLGENTWADITLFGIPTKLTGSGGGLGKKSPVQPIDNVLQKYQKQLLDSFDSIDSPYSKTGHDGKNKATIDKQINIRTGEGNPARAIVEEAKKEGSDLIVIGCSAQNSCSWEDGGNVPLKVAKDAACSVLVIKKGEKKLDRVLCCLDHDSISQESLEMVNQMVTLFKADLEIVVLTKNEDVQEKVEKKLSWLIEYYSARDIFPYIELVKLSSLEEFVSQQSRWGLMAMWMGKKSILESVFPSNKVSRLLKVNESSVLFLR